MPSIVSLERGDQGESVVSSQNWRISEASRVMGLLRVQSLASLAHNYLCPEFALSLVLYAPRSVTANIGWYVVSIFHDQPSCNIDITWPVESRLWVDRMCSFFWWVFIQNCCFPFQFRYYMIGVSCNIETTIS